MEIDEKVTQIENEIKVLKNEVQAVLLDIRESYLNRENPFNPEVSAIPIQPAIATITGGQQAPPPPAARREADNQALETGYEDESPETGGMDDDVVSTRKQPKQQEEDKLDADVVSTRKQPKQQEEDKLDAEEEPDYDDEESDADDEIAPEEVKRVRQSNIKPASHSRSKRTRTNGDSKGGNGHIDLITIAGLTQWVADTVKRLGRDKTETILDISGIVGLLSPELKNVLTKFVDRTSDEHNGSAATIRDYIASLVELERLLGMEIRSEEMALLSIICQEAQQ